MSKELQVNGSELQKLLNQLTKSQVSTNSTLNRFESRMQHMENLVKKEIYFTNSQLRELTKQVKDRVSTLCKHRGYNYKKSSKILFQAIYRSINGQYNVPSYRELPRAYFMDILESVKIWEVTDVIEDRIKAA